MRFLASARNDRILCGIGGSSGDSLSKSPLLPHHTTRTDFVIPNESAIRRSSEESPIKSDCILVQKETHIKYMIPDTRFYNIFKINGGHILTWDISSLKNN